MCNTLIVLRQCKKSPIPEENTPWKVIFPHHLFLSAPWLAVFGCLYEMHSTWEMYSTLPMADLAAWENEGASHPWEGSRSSLGPWPPWAKDKRDACFQDGSVGSTPHPTAYSRATQQSRTLQNGHTGQIQGNLVTVSLFPNVTRGADKEKEHRTRNTENFLRFPMVLEGCYCCAWGNSRFCPQDCTTIWQTLSNLFVQL